MSPWTYDKVRGHLASLHPIFAQASRDGLRIALTIVATTVWLVAICVTLFGRLLGSMLEHLHDTWRLTRVGTNILRRRASTALRKLREKEKEFEPQAAHVLQAVEDAVIETAVKTAPKAKSAIRRIGISLGVLFVTINILIILILIVAGIYAQMQPAQ